MSIVRTPSRSMVVLAVLLTALLAGSRVVAQGAGRGQGGPPPSAGGGSPPPAAGPRAPSGHVLVAPLRFTSEGVLVIDGGRVEAPPPWPRYLAPGMWLRAQGEWVGAVFEATAVAVTRPARFSYYCGPGEPLDLGNGWVEAWFEEPGPGEGVRLFELRRVAPGAETLALVRAAGGGWLALPPGLRPPPPPAADAWMLVHGRMEADALHWTGMEPFD